MSLTATFTLRRPDGFTLQVDEFLADAIAPVTALLGPSGAGKSTLLRCLAGLERPQQGTIRCGEQVWCDAARGLHLPPRARRVGFLFQDLALFPHLSAAQNVAFGLHRVPKTERRARVAAALEQAAIGELAERRPRELSGGQQQRVALARILAQRPALLLLDEPLSALDPPLRARLRGDLRRLLTGSGAPAVLVTHDRAEALALADRVAVVIDGRIRQCGPVAEVFGRPADVAVAQVVGTDSVVAGRIMELQNGIARIAVGRAELVAPAAGVVGQAVFVCIRGEEVLLQTTAPGPSSARNRLRATVTTITGEGPLLRVHLDCGFPLAATITPAARAELELAPGAVAWALVKASAIHLVPAAGG